jgi:cytolysin-activating lysine-acyltransferase
MIEQASGAPDQFKLVGEALYIYAHLEQRQNYTVSDITTHVTLPIVLNQYRMYWIDKTPVGFATWCYVSDAMLARLINDDRVEMTADDWRGGRNIWLMDLLAPFGHGAAMVNDLRRGIFANATVHSMRRYPDERTRHVVWRGVNVNRKPDTDQ